MSSCQLQRNTFFIELISFISFESFYHLESPLPLYDKADVKLTSCCFWTSRFFQPGVLYRCSWTEDTSVVLWRGYSRAFSLTLSYLSFNGCWQRKSTLLPPSGCSSTLQRWILGSKTTDRLHLCKCGLSLEEKLYLSSSRLLLRPLPYTRPRDLRKNENVIFLLTKNTWDRPTLF